VDVITLGIAVMDILAKPADKTIFDRDNTVIDEITVCPGGDATNQSIALAKLGLITALCCRIGDDAMGAQFFSAVQAHGVETPLIKTAASVTSTAIVLVSHAGDRNIICRRGNNYDFCFEDIDPITLKNTRALSIGSIFGMPRLEDEGLLQILQQAKQNGIVTFADMASDKKGLRLSGAAPFLPYIDYFLPSETESRHLTGLNDCRKAAQVFLDAGAKNVVIKLGSQGAYAHIDGYEGFVNPYRITPADTTGAGDAFCAGFICGVLQGMPAKETLAFASACGAFSALYPGANTAPISPETLFAFMRDTPRAAIY
jgi:sugar/nucleoside kinase (ribokinase family)